MIRFFTTLMVLRAVHWLAHQTSMNHGRIYSWTDSDTGRHMIGFRCDGCGCIQGVQEVDI